MQVKQEEAPKDFNRFLALVADGAASSELSAELQRVVGLIRGEAEARGEKVVGKLTLTLAIQIDPGGHADVAYDIVVKEPKKERPQTLFFVTKGDNLSDELTKQQRLPVREVTAPKAREANTDHQEAREV